MDRLQGKEGLRRGELIAIETYFNLKRAWEWLNKFKNRSCCDWDDLSVESDEVRRVGLTCVLHHEYRRIRFIIHQRVVPAVFLTRQYRAHLEKQAHGN